MSLNAPLQMPTLNIELHGIKQHMVQALLVSQKELQEAIAAQLTACLSTLTPELIVASVRRAFDDAVYTAVTEQAPELVERAVVEYFTKGKGADIVRDALKAKYGSR
jgi:hypothetical protein